MGTSGTGQKKSRAKPTIRPAIKISGGGAITPGLSLESEVKRYTL
jgi:hypothetical protein